MLTGCIVFILCWERECFTNNIRSVRATHVCNPPPLNIRHNKFCTLYIVPNFMALWHNFIAFFDKYIILIGSVFTILLHKTKRKKTWTSWANVARNTSQNLKVNCRQTKIFISIKPILTEVACETCKSSWKHCAKEKSEKARMWANESGKTTILLGCSFVFSVSFKVDVAKIWQAYLCFKINSQTWRTPIADVHRILFIAAEEEAAKTTIARTTKVLCEQKNTFAAWGSISEYRKWGVENDE